MRDAPEMDVVQEGPFYQLDVTDGARLVNHYYYIIIYIFSIIFWKYHIIYCKFPIYYNNFYSKIGRNCC